MRSQDSGCFILIVVIGVIISGIYSASQWLFSKATGGRAQSISLLEEAKNGVSLAEAGVQGLRAHGTLKQSRLENGQWVYAGENETLGTYRAGVLGEGRAECAKDITPAAEGAAFYRREFTAVFEAGIGRTLLTRQGLLTDPAPPADPELLLEKRRPRLMELCDAGTGWNCVIYGRWPGSGDDGLLFSEFLAGKRPGTTLRADSDHIRDLPTIRIRATQSSAPNTIHLYWLDINSGYGLIRYERREITHQTERQIEAWETKEFLRTPRGVYYPSTIEGERLNADGALTQKWRLDVEHIWVNEPPKTLTLFHPPAGKIVIHEEGQPEKIQTGTAEQNAAAINGAWADPQSETQTSK